VIRPANSNAQLPPLTFLIATLENEIRELRHRAADHGTEIALASVPAFCARMLVLLAAMRSVAEEKK
jgi:hypothetical protein